MQDYTYSTDNLKSLGFIDKNKILEYISEEDIFNLVFNFKPQEYDYTLSPLRKDKNPRCWFERGVDERLYFRDFAYGNKPLDCFEVVKLYFKIDNFYNTLMFIYDTLIKNKNLEATENIRIIVPKKKVQIFFESRNFDSRDYNFWKRYQISSQNLIDDKVFPVKKMMLLNTKKGNIKSRVYDIAYAYTDFEDNRKKLYFPFRLEKRFITNCTKNDIGGIKKLPPFGRQLYITKSYKDYRVLLNQGLYSIWIQNEGMKPDNSIILPIIKRFENVFLFYDNDETGINTCVNLSNEYNRELNTTKIKPLYLNIDLNKIGITDPSDMIYKKGKVELNRFLAEYR